jgi:hypothetical protein
MEYIINNYGEILGTVAAFVLICDRIAKLTPTEADNKIVQKVLKVVYSVFAILGLKVPDVTSYK